MALYSIIIFNFALVPAHTHRELCSEKQFMPFHAYLPATLLYYMRNLCMFNVCPIGLKRKFVCVHLPDKLWRITKILAFDGYKRRWRRRGGRVVIRKGERG